MKKILFLIFIIGTFSYLNATREQALKALKELSRESFCEPTKPHSKLSRAASLQDRFDISKTMNDRSFNFESARYNEWSFLDQDGWGRNALLIVKEDVDVLWHQALAWKYHKNISYYGISFHPLFHRPELLETINTHCSTPFSSFHAMHDYLQKGDPNLPIIIGWENEMDERIPKLADVKLQRLATIIKLYNPKYIVIVSPDYGRGYAGLGSKQDRIKRDFYAEEKIKAGSLFSLVKMVEEFCPSVFVNTSYGFNKTPASWYMFD